MSSEAVLEEERPLLVVCAHANCDDYFSGHFQVERSPSPFGKTPQDDLLLFLVLHPPLPFPPSPSNPES